MRRQTKQLQLRKFDIELEIEPQEIAHLIRQLGVTIQAARSLLVKPDRASVRAQIERRQRDHLISRVFHTQRHALRLKRQINA
jgi:hypothetical protein